MEKQVLFKEFEKLTDELLLIDLTKDIDDMIGYIEEKLAKREEVIDKIKSTTDGTVFPDEDLSRIMQKNNQLETKFSEIKLGITNSIKDIVTEKSLSSKKKKAQRGYLNVGVQTDGYFIDKKK